MTADLVAFLRGQFDAEESDALEAIEKVGDGHWQQRNVRIVTAADRDQEVADYAIYECIHHIIRHDPARVLAEIAAKRALIKRGDTLFCDCDQSGRRPPMDPDTNWTVPIPHHYDCTAYRIAQVLATAYRDHPDYREEWLPFEWAPDA
jgi:hypothetical protein